MSRAKSQYQVPTNYYPLTTIYSLNMKSSIIILFLIITPLLVSCQNGAMTPVKYREDFNYFWKTINDEYCYFDKKQTDWQKVKEIYSQYLDTITKSEQFVSLLEKALNELYDHHAILNTNTPKSNLSFF